jgi:hypothetical protein
MMECRRPEALPKKVHRHQRRHIELQDTFLQSHLSVAYPVIENRVIGAGVEAGVEAEEAEIKEDAVVDRANSMDQEVAEGVLVEDQLRVRYILIHINMGLQSKNTIPLKLEI